MADMPPLQGPNRSSAKRGSHILGMSNTQKMGLGWGSGLKIGSLHVEIGFTILASPAAQEIDPEYFPGLRANPWPGSPVWSM